MIIPKMVDWPKVCRLVHDSPRGQEGDLDNRVLAKKDLLPYFIDVVYVYRPFEFYENRSPVL